MGDTISNTLIKAYTDLVLMKAQQTESKLRSWCKVKDNVKGEAVSFDRIGMVEMLPKPSRHPDTPNADPNHERRWATLASWFTNIYLDTDDVQAALSDPTSDYVRVVSAGMGRRWDKLVLDASIGTATTGRVGEAGATGTGAVGSETWPVTDRKSVSHRITESGTVGMTMAKILQAKRILDALSVENDRVFVIDAYAIEDLLATVEATSSDYASIKRLERGELEGLWAGFSWVLVDSALMTVSSNIVSGIAMARGTVGLGIGQEKKIRIGEHPEKSWATGVYAEMAGGAVRRDGERIVEVQYYQ